MIFDKNTNFVPIDSIFTIRNEEKFVNNEKGELNFKTVEEIKEYLTIRQQIFNHTLERFSNEIERRSAEGYEDEKVNEQPKNKFPSIGWETKRPNGNFVQAHHSDKEAQFTAKNMCSASCIILYDFLSLRLSEEATISILSFKTRKKDNKIQPDFAHNILQINIGAETLYVDPTYRQIDSDYYQPFLFTNTLDELQKFYQSESGQIKFEDSTNTVLQQRYFSGLQKTNPLYPRTQQVLSAKFDTQSNSS